MDTILRKVQEDYNIIAKDFSRKRTTLWPEIQPYLKYIKPKNQVLDIGCGNGRLYKTLKAMNIGINYVGIDFSKELLNLAKKENPDGNFIYGDITQDKTWLRLRNYDLVFCIAVFHNPFAYYLKLKTLKHIHQALKPQGKLVLTVWNLWEKKFWPLHIKQLFWKITQGFKFKWLNVPYKLSDGNKITLQVNRLMYSYTKQELTNLIKSSGFRVLNLKSGRNLCFLAERC